MRLHSLLIGLTAATAASATPVSTPSNGAVSEQDVIAAMLHNKGLNLPTYTHRMLEARVDRLLSKRQTTTPPASGTDFSAMLDDVGGLLKSMGLQGGAFGAKSKPPPSTVPDIQDLGPSAARWQGSGASLKRSKVRYGPYRIPPTSEKNFESQILNVQGMSNTLEIGVKKPCEKECTLLSVVADMEYADGKAMKTKDAWLHHVVLLNSGANVVEVNCGMPLVENIFMDGNERTTNGYALPNSTVKSGYSLTSDNSFILTTELMNMVDDEKWAWVTLTYEYLDGPQPDYKQGKTVWLSIGPAIAACGRWDVASPFGPSNLTWTQQPKSDKFVEHSFPWNATRDGLILSTGGHMHDGGVSTQIFQNGKKICDSLPHYGKGAGHGMKRKMKKRQMGGGAASNSEIEHIETQDACTFTQGLPMKKGDSVYLSVDYDFKRYPGMKNKKGELDEVMGIVGMLVAF